MALFASGTPKANFVSNRRNTARPTATDGNNESSESFTAPNTARNVLTTPKRQGKPQVAPSTPECFNKVVLETPNSALKQRNSKEKFDEVSNLTVAVRIRPMNTRELSCVGAYDVVRVRNQDLIIRSSPAGNAGMSLDHIFQYDHIFWSCDEASPLYSSQEEVFLTVGKPLLNSAFKGYNACLFAYGQTGSGKSFSMMGRNNCEIVDIDCDVYSGLIPRFCRDLFERVSSLNSNASAAVEVSYFEIYNEKIHDLLSTQSSNNKTPLKVREHPVWGPYVVDLSTHKISNFKELRNWILLGNKNRATAATNMNEKSSRSHSIFSIELCLTEGMSKNDRSRRSKVSLVDLAGSERLSNSHGNDEKIRQGVSINKSLLTLGKVILSLADQKKNAFVPYRESVLTWLLKESLGGNSLTSMLATISPASSHLDETLATLRYACQARSIVNRARVNENPHDRLIRELRLEVERLRALRKDYERSSLSCSSLHLSDVSLNNTEELEDLKRKLSETENKLVKAEESWQQRFLETKKLQLQELANAERIREELESRMRVMKNAEEPVVMSPFRSNFLAELENVLCESSTSVNVENNTNSDSCDREIELINDIKKWCHQNNLDTELIGNLLIIKDHLNKKQTTLSFSEFYNLSGYENISDFLNSLQWTDLKSERKLTKNEVVSTMNQIYTSLSTLQPTDNQDNLSLLYAKVNKSLQGFETALINNFAKASGQKSVTFNINQEDK